ncbi:hypothetical protein P3X46_003129 [Hevea brasiliensis]|uniref:Pentatricopeptide repeat-containing protein n=1 Tax=Hevea brasiliensis TaxID=3981 RepID=A0ABQ9N911_HEVBR|nr:hypothetical protein P3X46_003129 [Hevea brasiliensis]
MKRVFKISDAVQAELLSRRRLPTVSHTLAPFTFTLTKSLVYRLAREHGQTLLPANVVPNVIALLSNKFSQVETNDWNDLRAKVSHLRDELVLGEKRDLLFGMYTDGSAFIELLKQLVSWPHLAVEQGSTCTYNALMGAYMYNGHADNCQSLFHDLKRINLNVSPTLSTFNNLIAGYITAWMWDGMENTFQMMKEGYAHCGNLGKIQETYELVKDHVNLNARSLVRAMIGAYCKSSITYRIKKIEALLRLIPEEEYEPWLNVLLIRVKVQPDLLEGMENSINEAFQHKTTITTTRVMQTTIACYFRCNAVDRLADFNCRPLYHCKIVIYASQKHLDKMENVLNEMENCNLKCTKRTFVILYKSLFMCGKKYKVEQIVGLMYKHGHGIPLGASPS